VLDAARNGNIVTLRSVNADAVSSAAMVSGRLEHRHVGLQIAFSAEAALMAGADKGLADPIGASAFAVHTRAEVCVVIASSTRLRDPAYDVSRDLRQMRIEGSDTFMTADT
jgi:hypothetical protein